jgi:hypothetical protein
VTGAAAAMSVRDESSVASITRRMFYLLWVSSYRHQFCRE